MASLDSWWQCPFCSTEYQMQVFRCGACRAILTLKDIDALLNNVDVDQEQLLKAVEGYRNAAREQADFNIQYYLSLAFLNLQKVDEALTYLGEAIGLRPTNKVLRAVMDMLAKRSKEAKAPIRNEASTTDRHARRTVLVVDDSRIQVMFVSRILEKSGCQVITASDGNEALSKVRGVDLILLDIHMPGMDGYQVCKVVQENLETARIPVILLSGQDEALDNERGRFAGARGYLTKPCVPELLLQAVERFCQPAVAAG